MKRRFVISLAGLEEQLRPHVTALRKQGIDLTGLLAYTLNAGGSLDYKSLVGYLSKDVADLNPALLEDYQNFQRVLHTCLDGLDKAAGHISPLVERTCGVPCDRRVEFEEYLGDDDAVISIVY